MSPGGFSMSRRDSDSEKVPAALYDRLTDTPTYAARMYKVQLSIGSPLAIRPAGVCPGCPPSGWFPTSAGCGISGVAWPCSGGLVQAHPALVLPECDVQAPVRRVLNAPVSTRRRQQPFRRNIETAYVVSRGCTVMPVSVSRRPTTSSPPNATRASPCQCSAIPDRPGR